MCLRCFSLVDEIDEDQNELVTKLMIRLVINTF